MTITAALDTHTAMRRALEGRVLSSVAGVMRSNPDWFNLSESWDATSEISSLVDGGVRQEAVNAQAFMNTAYSEMGISAREPSLDINGSLRTGTTSDLSYRRAGSDMRRHLNSGTPEAIALDLVLERLQEMVADDLALAMREQSRRFFMANQRTTLGYRRIVRPELSTTGTCGLCMVASDRIYSRSDLLPIHTRCRCDVLPVTSDYDPGEMNNVDLAALYEAAGSNRAGDLLNVKVRDVQHGELGPRIVNADHPGAAEYKGYLRHRIPDRQERNNTEILANNEKRIIDIEARFSAGVELDSDARELQQAREQANDAREWLKNFHTGRQNLAQQRRAA